jgi:RNA polymerase sigma factor (sigma-70 family)
LPDVRRGGPAPDQALNMPGAYTSKFDSGLIEAARGGDRQAIVSLLSAAQPDIRRYAAQSCSKFADIDDAVQETLWILYRRVGTLHTLNSLAGWLLTIVRRECLRLASRITGRNLDVAEVAEDPQHLARFATLPMDDLRLDVARAIESLPEHYREVVLLRDVEEMTIDEIASALAQTRESVKGKLHRARLLLREYLADQVA